MMSFEDIGREVGKLVDEKNKAYGDSFGKAGSILSVLYPDGIRVDQYTDMLAVVRILDKLFRIATDRDALGESPFKDITGYGLLGMRNAQSKTKAEPLKTEVSPNPVNDYLSEFRALVVEVLQETESSTEPYIVRSISSKHLLSDHTKTNIDRLVHDAVNSLYNSEIVDLSYLDGADSIRKVSLRKHNRKF